VKYQLWTDSLAEYQLEILLSPSRSSVLFFLYQNTT